MLLWNRPSFEILDVWLERLARRIATGRRRSSDLRQEIDNFKGTTTTNTSPSLKRTDVKLSSRSPSPLNKKSDFKINEFPSAERSMDTTDSKDHSDTNSTNDVSKTTSNGISKAISHSSKINCISHNDNNHISHTSRCISPIEIKTQTQTVPSTPIKKHSNEGDQRIENGFIGPMDESLSFREINEIPKSPHLSKDFSPNGERLRSSIRFRRQERMQKQRTLRSLANKLSQQNSWDSGGENSTPNENEIIEPIPNYFNYSKMPFTYSNDVMPAERRKSKPYGEKGFIIQMNDGALTLNDVKDLNNCYSDDFDSSCDTSLNYIDPDSLNTTTDAELDVVPMTIPNYLKSPMKTISFDTTLLEIDGPIAFSLDEVRDNLNKCKSKLDALQIVDTKIGMKKLIKPKSKVPKVSLNDVFVNGDKQKQQSNESKPSSVFGRLHPLSSPALNSRSSSIPKKSPDSPPKTITMKRESPVKSNGAKNYCKNTMSFIEKINDGLNDRHLRLPQNGKVDDRKSTKKPNNNSKSNNSSYSRSDQSMEMLTTKPPAPNSHKKRSDGNKSSTNRNNDNINGKQKKTNNLHSSPTHKRL